MAHPRAIHGTGPKPCEFMFVGEGPGWEEDKNGVPFVGKTGQELNRFLDGNHLPAREEVFLTNIYRHYNGKDYIYTTEDLARDEQELIREIQQVLPRVIVPLGRHATRWFLGDVDLEDVQGIPWKVKMCYGCLGHARKVLVASEEDAKRLLAMDWGSQQSRLRLDNVALQNTTGAPIGISTGRKYSSPDRGIGSSLSYPSLRQSSASRTRHNQRKQPTCKATTNSMSVGPSLYGREHVSNPTRDSKVSRVYASGRSETCPACANPFSEITVFPIVHIAAAFHNPEMSPYVVAGFEALADYLAGKTEPRVLFNDPHLEPHYENITTVARLEAVLGGWRKNKRGASCAGYLEDNLAIDTEGYPHYPWSIQFSFQSGVGYLIRANNLQVLEALAAYLNRERPRVIYHSALHDLAMMRVLGLPVDLEFDDTMVMAYLLQLEPQGLKALCVRHCGMQMQSYDDVLGDAGQRLALDYLSGLWDVEQLDYEERCNDAFWHEIDCGRRITKIPQLPKSQLHKATERALRSKDARKLWANQIEDIQVAGYNRLGLLPQPTLDHVALPVAIRYGSRDADGTTRVRVALRPRIEHMGLADVYQLELGTYPLIERMTHVGIKPDLGHFALLSTRLATELETLQGTLAERTAVRDFNANSGDQVADYLFDGLGLEGVTRVSSGRFSTNDKILEALEHEHPEHPTIGTIREYREVYKLKNTFTDRLPDFVRRWPFDGRIHATFRTTRVVTGRLAASDPNLLAMPKHGKFAKDFRRGWVPEHGHILAEWDLSQIELRVLAHLSQDPVMLAIFRGEKRNKDGSKIDLHAALAQRIFGVAPKDQDNSKHRLPAKAVNFGLPMGMTFKGLAVELRKNGLNVSEDDAQRWIDETMKLYKGVPIYQDAMAAQARRQGYIRCLSGRIRYIGGIRSRDERIQAEARRFAFSTPIQEGAQWLMKQAERRLYEDILVPYWKAGRWVEPLIQVHDALTLECEDDPVLAQDLHTKMVANMTQAPTGFSVPIETSGDWGHNWAEMRAF